MGAQKDVEAPAVVIAGSSTGVKLVERMNLLRGLSTNRVAPGKSRISGIAIIPCAEG